MVRISITLKDGKKADFSVSDGETEESVELSGCYMASVVNMPEQLYDHSQHDIKLAKERSVQLPELPKTDSSEVGRFLVLYFAENHYLMQPPLCEFVRIPPETVKSLDDTLAEFNLSGKAFGRNFTCYNTDKYRIPLPEGMEITIR